MTFKKKHVDEKEQEEALPAAPKSPSGIAGATADLSALEERVATLEGELGGLRDVAKELHALKEKIEHMAYLLRTV